MESFNNFNGFVSENRQIKSFYLAENWTTMLLGVIVSVPLLKYFTEKLIPEKAADAIRPFAIAVILLVSVSFIVKGSYNPFIYFNF